MQLEVAVVADYANLAEGGKLNIMGIFDRIQAASFPTMHAYMVLAFRLRMEFEDRARKHHITIRLLDEDGKQFAGGEGDIEVGEIPPGEHQSISQSVPFAGLVFPKPGRYSFNLQWNNEPPHQVPFFLVKSAPQPADS